MQKNSSGKKAFLVGITGMIGGGKSTATQLLQESGAFVIHADNLAKRYTSSESPILSELVELLGPEILDENGNPDRKKISDIVFSDKEKLNGLNKLIHPRVRADFLKLLETDAAGKLVVWEVPLLFETDAHSLCDATVTVDSDEEISILRAMKRDGMKKEEVLARISNQLPLSEKLKKADYIVNNKGNLESLREECRRLYTILSGRMS
ncbi:dephospho-CoA kinase [Leptospira gomenensis]|uniref:Dephospho-CoA kinase n=1 Tax=Leptospira gomenensis TaxID=2484974 RepID=A0A5F1YJB6_9LEPT|nr:dephospho-CoA kinase [Leptospira gomenensis]TGK34554.1 dephospho-CoA kinase [Leptospira gomenensis]TGK40136.1 dephospho-CoA kinase [Leptospira gomenensis]TGK40453.1 dephospho-CoA kinase [Leptospira gomenensis]TGK55645.1 dephospho-CoA kinase [Leptospira gomenensis]